MKSELDILREVSEKLASCGIPFMLTGSVAMSYYAQPRMTRDIDIVIALNPENAGDIEKLFGATYYLAPEAVREAVRRRSMFNVIHLESVIKVDFIVLPDTDFAMEEFSRRSDIVIDDFQTTIISREDLILSKLVWARDSESNVQLKDVRNLLAENCDREYLHKWATRLSVLEPLDSLLKSNE